MKVFQKLIFISLLSIGFLVSCTEQKECSNTGGVKKVGKYNMREDSELTTLMREMEEDFKKMKTALKNGEPAKPSFDYSKILEAHSTEPEVAESESFKAFAQSFLQTMEAFEKSDVEQSTELFESLVTSCLNCHQVHCPGPMVRIKKLHTGR